VIHDLLYAYREHLLETYRPETARTYYKRLCTLFEGQSLSMTNGLDIESVLDNLGQIKYKNYFSQAKNAFLHFCEFQNIALSPAIMERISELENGTQKKYRKLTAIQYSEIDRKIKHIKNKKLKLCYQVIIATGLRVSELAGITPNDSIIAGDGIVFNFIGKGGNRESVMLKATEYPKLYQSLLKLIENTHQEKKIFYSVPYLQKKARELGFKCHDLRRIYAKIEYKKFRSRVEVMKKLRHSSPKTTNIYLRSKVKI